MGKQEAFLCLALAAIHHGTSKAVTRTARKLTAEADEATRQDVLGLVFSTRDPYDLIMKALSNLPEPGNNAANDYVDAPGQGLAQATG